MAPSCVCPRRTCFGFIEKHGSTLCLSQKILFWVHWKAWLHLVFVPEHLVLGSLESMAASRVCPRTSCFGFTGKHGSIFCLSQNILFWLTGKHGSNLCLSQNIMFWVHWKAWLHLLFVPEHLVLGSLESMAPSSVCPRTSCFGFTGKHDLLLPRACCCWEQRISPPPTNHPMCFLLPSPCFLSMSTYIQLG
jgi:hypothetical protein